MNHQSSPSPFLKKLHKILMTTLPQPPTFQFQELPLRIIIHNPEIFESTILPRHFRHSNIHSFVRQLNFYGFHKIKEQSTITFEHPLLQRVEDLIITHIPRKQIKNNKRISEHECKEENSSQGGKEKQKINQSEILKMTTNSLKPKYPCYMTQEIPQINNQQFLKEQKKSESTIEAPLLHLQQQPYLFYYFIPMTMLMHPC